MFDYQLIRSDRKTLSIEIGRDGSLTVRAPKRMARTTIAHYLESRSDWIDEKRRQILARRAAVFSAGEAQTIWYLGKQYALRRHDAPNVKAAPDAVFVPQDWSTEQIRAWFKAECRRVVAARLAVFSQITGLRPTALHITEAKTRWGSCSSKNSVSFSLRLVFCPPEVIDYVIVHELCHIRHKNHSAIFWALVAQYDPAYRAKRGWLREHAALMDLF